MRTARARLCDPDHLDRAAAATVRGKRRRRDVAWFLFRLEDEIARIQAELASGRYRPAGFELVRIRDPKPRLIARVPIAERVVHTALVDLMEPVFCRSLVSDAFACRPGKGTHRALLRLLELVRRDRFVLHLDIKSYFPSVDLEILRRLIARRIRDPPFLEVVDRVLEAGRGIYDQPELRKMAGLDHEWPPPGRGLPIGSHTSQLFAAQVYLSGLDHFVKRELKVPGYVRYVDDLFLFGRGRGELRGWRGAVGEWLASKRGLRLKHPQARILSCRGSLHALGHRVRRQGVEPLPRALKSMTEDNLDSEPVDDLEDRLYRPEADSVREDLERVARWRPRLSVFLDELAKCSGILGPHDGPDGDWRYWRRTFREALAAEALEEQVEAEGSRRLPRSSWTSS